MKVKKEIRHVSATIVVQSHRLCPVICLCRPSKPKKENSVAMFLVDNAHFSPFLILCKCVVQYRAERSPKEKAVCEVWYLANAIISKHQNSLFSFPVFAPLSSRKRIVIACVCRRVR
jgi:hypothetical protein